MRHLVFSLLILPLLYVCTGASAYAQSPSTKKVLDEMVLALGGQPFLDVDDIHSSGRFFQFRRGQLTGADYFQDYIKFPDMERTEFGREKSRTITINRGNQAWKKEPKDKEFQQQSAGDVQEFLAAFKTSFDYVVRFVLNQNQTTMQSLGTEMIDFNRTDVVELREATKTRIRLYVDRNSHLPVKMQVRRSNDNILREETYANWHMFQGIMTPLFVTQFKDAEKTTEIRVETASYNTGLADSLFSPPATK
jgi:Outer membrane lipoprotein-sorting protein